MLDKRYDPHQVEEGKYENWKSKGYFTAGDKSKTPYTIVIPPPNVTGKLHIGHAWDTTIQDIIARYKRLQGFDMLYLPGMDHAGIATQAKVMQKLVANGVDVTKITRDEFLKWAWAWKDEYADNIHKQWAKMGISLDYTRERFTLDEGLNYAVRTVFVTLYNKGLIYQGERIINWDPVQQTALSNIEVIHQDDPGQMFYFKYPIVGEDDSLIVATTRPETMFGDVCVVINPNDENFKEVLEHKCTLDDFIKNRCYCKRPPNIEFLHSDQWLTQEDHSKGYLNNLLRELSNRELFIGFVEFLGNKTKPFILLSLLAYSLIIDRISTPGSLM